MVDKPLNTDRQADKAARRKVRLDTRKKRIEDRRDVRLERLEARIKKIKAEAAERIGAIDDTRVSLGMKLIDFVLNVRKHKRSVTLSTGTELVVYTNHKVVAKDGDDEAAAAELVERGLHDYVRVRKEPNRQLLAQKQHRHIVKGLDRLSLEPVRTLKINLAQE